LLRKEFARRGLALSLGGFSARLGQHSASAAMAPHLVRSTVQSASLFLGHQAGAGVVSQTVLAVAEGVLQTMWLTKLKYAATLVLLSLATLGALALHLQPAAQSANERAKNAAAAAKTASELKPLHSVTHDGPVLLVGFANTDNRVVSCSADDTIRFWDMKAGKEIDRQRDANQPRPAINCFAISADGKTIAHSGRTQVGSQVGCREFIKNLKNTYSGYSDGETVFAYTALSADGRYWVAAGKKNGHAEFCDLTDYKAGGLGVRAYELPETRPTSFGVSPDGAVLACGSADKVLWLLDRATGTQRQRVLGHRDAVTALAFSADSKIVASGSKDKSIVLWDATGMPLRRFVGHPDTLTALAFSPDGHMLASAGEGGDVLLWNALAQGAPRRLGQHRGRVNSLAFSADGKSLVTGGDDHTVQLWDVHKNITTPLPAPTRLGSREMDVLWSDLGGTDLLKAFAAIDRLIAASQQTIPYLQQCLRPPEQSADDKRVTRLIHELDAKQFDVRQQAYDELETLGKAAELPLRQALATKPPLEVSRRIEDLLAKLKGPSVLTSQQWQAKRGIEVLAAIGTPEAQQILKTLANEQGSSWFASEANAALERVARRPFGP
jgi:WD40 repeat protein